MLQIFTVLRREFTDVLQNKIFSIFLFFLLLLSTTSIYIGSINYHVKLSTFEEAYKLLISNGMDSNKLSRPEFYPLQMLRGVIEFLEIIGAILAISLGYLSVTKDKDSNVLPIILTRPITRSKYFLGKYLGNIFILLALTIFLFSFIVWILYIIGGVGFSSLEIMKICIVQISSFFYLSIFYIIAALVTTLMKNPTSALILIFLLWLIFVLVIPQIGDTMDVDNQVPGGFFSALKLNKNQSDTILKDFTFYETGRNAAEEASITKHYERFSFAVLGVKESFNDKSLNYIFEQKNNEVYWLSSYFVIFSIGLFLVNNREVI